jgi:beta-galactosidase/beta-glucuronidase
MSQPPLAMNLRTLIRALIVLLLTTAAVLHAANDQPISLAGTWRFELDRADVGVNERWFTRALPDTIQLPGSLQERGYGDDISTKTVWTGSLNERSWFTADRYAPYRQPGNVKVPFWLQPEKSYLGAAWYQRDIDIPKSWQGRRLVVQFERAHWGTTLWLDDQKIGSRDALGTPHEYDLGTAITSGRHQLTLRVDNRPLIAVGADAHSITDHTQGNWNGVAGRLELVATDPLWFDEVRVFPSAAKRQARVEVKLGNSTGQPGSGTLKARVLRLNWRYAPPTAPLELPIQWSADGGQVNFTCELGPDASLWDEFGPFLHELTLEIPGVISPHPTTFGLRDVALVNQQIVLNQ